MVPEITLLKMSEEFDGKKEGIWTSSENTWIYKGIILFFTRLDLYEDIFLEDGTSLKSMYINGIHKEIHYWLEERWWYSKWYDMGTLFFWKYENVEPESR